MILETATQRDADWYAARVGKATASRFKDATAYLRSGDPAQAQRDYVTGVAIARGA